MQRGSFAKKFICFLVLCAGTAVLSGCDKPDFDPATQQGKKAILEQVNIYLSQGRCTEAVAEILPLYDSANTDNEVRLIAASAYACAANVNFFKLVGDLAGNAKYMTPTSFWSLLAKLFPSDSTDFSDRAVEGGLLATEALQAMLKPGAIILPGNYVNEGTYNPGARIYSDRVNEANTYLLFVSMATIGALENRFASPAPSAVTHNGGSFPWGLPFDLSDPLDLKLGTPTHPSIREEGCWLGSAVVNFADSLDVITDTAQGGLKDSLETLKTAVQGVIFNVCHAACTNAGGSCAKCPRELRDRTVCTGEADDMPSVAAAAIAGMINNAWTDPVP